MSQEGYNTTPDNSNETLEKSADQEKIEKFNIEMKALLDQALSSLPQQMNEYYNSNEYKKLLELVDKKDQEEKDLFEVYQRITRGDDSHRRTSFGIGRGMGQAIIDDLRFGNAPKDVIKRFEDFDGKFVKPVFDAEPQCEIKAKDTILKDKWVFGSSLQEMADEVFKSDNELRKEMVKKWSDSYERNSDKIREESVPGKIQHIQTWGKVFDTDKK